MSNSLSSSGSDSAEVADVAAEPDVVADEAHGPATEVDAELAIVHFEQRFRTGHVRLHQSRAAREVGRNPPPVVPPAGTPMIAFTMNVVTLLLSKRSMSSSSPSKNSRCRRNRLPAENAGAHPPDGCAIGKVLSSAGAAAETGPHVRRKQPVRARHTRCQQSPAPRASRISLAFSSLLKCRSTRPARGEKWQATYPKWRAS